MLKSAHNIDDFGWKSDVPRMLRDLPNRPELNCLEPDSPALLSALRETYIWPPATEVNREYRRGIW